MCDTQKRLSQHIVRTHRYDPNFIVQCCIDQCMYSTKSWNAYKIHVSRRYKDENKYDLYKEIENGFLDMDDLDINNDDAIEKRNFSVASYMLNLEGEHKLSQNALNTIATSTNIFVNQIALNTKQQLSRKLAEHNVDENILDGIEVLQRQNISLPHICMINFIPNNVIFIQRVCY